jgi:hypothetical protein
MKIQTKIREILQREATIKCKINNEVFMKQSIPRFTKSPAMSYQ